MPYFFLKLGKEQKKRVVLCINPFFTILAVICLQIVKGMCIVWHTVYKNTFISGLY